MLSCNLPLLWFFQSKIKFRLFTGLKNLKKLVLEINTSYALGDYSLLDLTRFMKACPYLRIFVLKVRVYIYIYSSCIFPSFL
jgi:hypothetical protein